MNALKSTLRRMHGTRAISPAGFALRAAAIFVIFAVLHMAGFREYASVLSGTVPQGSFGGAVDRFLAMAYIVFYLGAVVAAPILTLGALVFWGLDRVLLRRRGGRNG